MDEKIKIPSDALVMMVGVAGSGKSTLARQVFGDNSIIVSSDECRKELFGDESQQENPEQVFSMFYEKIKVGLLMGERVIADATNLDVQMRKRLYEIADMVNSPVYAIVMNIPLEEIKNQNAKRERVVPEEVIERQFKKMSKAYYDLDNELPNGHIIDICQIPNEKDKIKGNNISAIFEMWEENKKLRREMRELMAMTRIHRENKKNKEKYYKLVGDEDEFTPPKRREGYGYIGTKVDRDSYDMDI